MNERTRVAAALSLVALVAGGCGGTQEAGLLSRVSNSGQPVRVRAPGEIRQLDRSKVDPQTLRLLASREGISVLWAHSTGRGPCFLAGRNNQIGLTLCGPTKYPFPSARLPAIDMSILAAKAGQLHPLVTTFSGIAADGVARMAVRFVTGPEFTVPVIRNTYIASQVPQRPALMAVALDQQGQVVAKIPWPVPPTIVRARSPH